jgi:DNA-binding response OmpR family regulator
MRLTFESVNGILYQVILIERRIRGFVVVQEQLIKSVLFVEDEQELLSTVSALLSDQGYRVATATTAEEALRIMKDSVPDLLLVDIKLPGIDGFDFFLEVKKDERFKGIPVVFLTAFNNLDAAMYAKEHGAAEYITKPFDFEYLITVVKGLVPPL